MADESEPLEKPGTNWSQREVDLAVSTYFTMWNIHLAGQVPNKKRHYEAFDLQTGRGLKSIEAKCQNISAVLERLGLPWLPGLAPLRNYQKLLISAVEAQVQRIWDMEPAQHMAAKPSGLAEPLILFPEAAPLAEVTPKPTNADLERLARKFDPAMRDLRNRKTGYLGEEIVFHSERARLSAAGRDDLARKVKWVSQEEGDGAGYDIRSFEADGSVYRPSGICTG